MFSHTYIWYTLDVCIYFHFILLLDFCVCSLDYFPAFKVCTSAIVDGKGKKICYEWKISRKKKRKICVTVKGFDTNLIVVQMTWTILIAERFSLVAVMYFEFECGWFINDKKKRRKKTGQTINNWYLNVWWNDIYIYIENLLICVIRITYV